MRYQSSARLSGFAAFAFAAVLSLPLAGTAAAQTIDRPQLLDDLRVLAADDMEGRLVATPGNARARAYIISRFEQIGVEPIGESYETSFVFNRPQGWNHTTTGTNIVGRIRGTGDSGRVMVISAHYDHMGAHGGQIWNGADDNASGVSGMLAAAALFAANPPEHDIIFAAFDAEEEGLRGAEAFVAHPPVPLETIAFNLNLDMLAMSEPRILWAVGTYHYPYLMPIVEAVRARSAVDLPTGFDEPSEDHGADWTDATDSGAFHAEHIPFIYLGVDYHEHYHEPTDTYENMTLDFFQDAAETVADFAREADQRLDEIGDAAGR